VKNRPNLIWCYAAILLPFAALLLLILYAYLTGQLYPHSLWDAPGLPF
jgi:hypothetical protein